MKSLRQSIIEAVAVKAAAAGVPVIVMPTQPRERREALWVAVRGVEDQHVRIANDRAERRLAIAITAVGREGDALAACDDALCRIHAALMGDMTLGGIALSIEAAEARYLAEDADAVAVAIEQTYFITYRAMRGDLTQKG